MKRKLPQAPPEGLGAPTIMDRALAAEHGSPYVHIAVFAIDIDRIYTEFDGPHLSFGWEVWLSELQLLRCLEPLDPLRRLRLVEDMAMSVLEQPPDAQGLGGQLVFAVYDAFVRGALCDELDAVFRSWRKPPKELEAALAHCFERQAELAPELVSYCLTQPLSPPLSEITQNALSAIAADAAGCSPTPPQR